MHLVVNLFWLAVLYGMVWHDNPVVLRYVTSRARVVPPHALYMATADQGGHLAGPFCPGFEITQSRYAEGGILLYENSSTFNNMYIFLEGLLRLSGSFSHGSHVVPATRNLTYESCSTARPLYGDGGSGWAIVVSLGFSTIARQFSVRD